METNTISKNGASPKSLMSRGNLLLIICFALLAVFNGCTKDKDDEPFSGHPILGTWSYDALGIVTDYYTFKADGTGTYKVALSGSSSISSEFTFKWTISGTKVTITNTGKASSSMATEIFFDSDEGTFYDVRYPSLHYTKQTK